MATAAGAQTQPASQQTTTTTQTPTQTQTTTTDSSTTAVPGTPATPAQTQTTTTQSTTTTPTDPAGTPVGPSATATSTSTTTTSAGAATAATAADVKKGLTVYDAKGGRIGTVESVSGKDAVVSTGTARASIPISSFAKNDKGLVLATTKAEIDAQAKASAKPKK
ncbi:hypothetical protein [Sphingomonas sp.]|uniref:hypothetical protein n=1 Tax=Sphingomonas sp. TaxID=28214 RepID=UPI0025DEC98D|nr:hypothetical protein [Sphingomonas sp.]MBV9529193.1 hypothetical protein [Sphingomonas sp.]